MLLYENNFKGGFAYSSDIEYDDYEVLSEDSDTGAIIDYKNMQYNFKIHHYQCYICHYQLNALVRLLYYVIQQLILEVTLVNSGKILRSY